ncbi:hypothetical protein GCM10009528_35950 [Kineococcus aurantiacus]
MRVAVGAEEADCVVAGQVGDGGALAHEPQQQDRLGEASQDAAALAGSDADAVGDQRSGDGLYQGAGDVETGTIGEHTGAR